jgi:hypothetical protein
MKKLIPFTLERWQQGNCTVKTADGRQIEDLAYQPSHEFDYVLCGIRGGFRENWKENGIYSSDPDSGNNLMLEVDCEVVYVSLFRRHGDKEISSVINYTSGLWDDYKYFIKEIKVEL